MNIHGVKIVNIENFENNKEINELNIKIILANHKRYKAEQVGNKIIITDKKTNSEVYTINMRETSEEYLEALNIAFNNNVRERKYELLFTCKPEEYVYVLLPTMLDENKFTFKALDILYAKVDRIYGSDEIYALTDLIEAKDNPKRYTGIPNVFCFKNIYNAITACKITPDSGYGSLREYIETCEKYIKYHYKADTGYDYKTVIPYEFLVDYDIDGSTFTYNLEYDTDKECAYTYTLPIAFNEVTDKIIKNITECRADSLGKDGINISINNEQIKIKRIRVDVSFDIERIQD